MQSWHDYYHTIAQTVAMKSKDQTKVGASHVDLFCMRSYNSFNCERGQTREVLHDSS